MPIITQSILFVYAHCVVLTYYVKRFRVILLYLALYKCYNNNNNNIVDLFKGAVSLRECKIQAGFVCQLYIISYSKVPRHTKILFYGSIENLF